MLSILLLSYKYFSRTLSVHRVVATLYYVLVKFVELAIRYWKGSHMQPGASNLTSTALINLSPLSFLLTYFSIGGAKKQQQHQHAQQKQHAQQRDVPTEIRTMVTMLK